MDYATLPDGLYAELCTGKGTIVVFLEHERTPLTVANFVGLAEGVMKNQVQPLGVPYYDGLKFHRVIEDFMIQGGCPDGTGRGGPGYRFQDECCAELRFDKPGILGMANSGPHTNGSQFFITHGATPHLNGRHTVFGHVVEGQDIVDAIEQGDQIKTVTIIRNGDRVRDYAPPPFSSGTAAAMDGFSF